MNDIGKNTNKLVPSHTYVPWLVVNGKHDVQAEDQIRIDLFQYVCRNYKGPNRSYKCGMSYNEEKHSPMQLAKTWKDELKIDVFLQ